jgi:hypothetical protein
MSDLGCQRESSKASGEEIAQPVNAPKQIQLIYSLKWRPTASVLPLRERRRLADLEAERLLDRAAGGGRLLPPSEDRAAGGRGILVDLGGHELAPLPLVFNGGRGTAVPRRAILRCAEGRRQRRRAGDLTQATAGGRGRAAAGRGSARVMAPACPATTHVPWPAGRRRATRSMMRRTGRACVC